MALVTPVVEHWVGREIAQWVHPMKDRSDDSLPRNYISLHKTMNTWFYKYRDIYTNSVYNMQEGKQVSLNYTCTCSCLNLYFGWFLYAGGNQRELARAKNMKKLQISKADAAKKGPGMSLEERKQR